MSAMMTAREVIADALRQGNTDHESYAEVQVWHDSDAIRIIAALRSAGYVIIKDRTDPEGGIPGRKI